MAQLLQFPSVNTKKTMREGNNVYWNKSATRDVVSIYDVYEKRHRFNKIDNVMHYDYDMTKYMGFDDREKKGGKRRQRNETDYVFCYLSFIDSEERGFVNKTSAVYRRDDVRRAMQILQIVKQGLYLIENYKSRLNVFDAYNADRSLRIGELKRDVRFLLAYYLKVKEGLLCPEVINDFRLAEYKRIVKSVCDNITMKDGLSNAEVALRKAS